MCVRACVGARVCACVCVMQEDRSIGPPGAGVIGVRDPPDMGAKM